MPYRILKLFIQKGTKTKEEILAMADVYYAAGRINAEEYSDVVKRADKLGTTSGLS